MDMLRAMEIFSAVAEARSLSEAGRRLHLTASAVSKQIAALEHSLGATLLSRTTRGLNVTHAGQEYLAHASRIIIDVARAQDAIRGTMAGPRGTLRIGTPAGFGLLHVAPAIPVFLRRFPEVRVELGLFDRQTDPIVSGIDVAIRMGHLRNSSFIAAKLAPTKRILCASPDYLEGREAPAGPDDLARHNCLISTLYTVRNTWFFTKDGKTRTVAVRGTFSANNSEALRGAALAGLGVALLGSWAVGPDVRSGRLVPLLGEWRGEVTRGIRHVHAVYQRAPHVSPTIRSFVDFLREHYGSPPYWDRLGNGAHASS
jgi:DNA-binding transcriptional LysR family regulator